jgi:hypothetical protein
MLIPFIKPNVLFKTAEKTQMLTEIFLCSKQKQNHLGY